MGCFNATCMVSNLPIACGDPIVMLVLCRNKWAGEPKLDLLHVTEEWAIVGYPFFGNYDDYGAIEEVEETPSVKHTINYLIANFDHAVEDRGDRAVVPDFDKTGINLDLVCGHDLKTIKLRSTMAHYPGAAKHLDVTRTFMHRRIWDHLTSEFMIDTYEKPDYKRVNVNLLDSLRRDFVKRAQEIEENSLLSHVALRRVIRAEGFDRIIQGGEGDCMVGQLEFFDLNPIMFMEDTPPLVAFKEAMYYLRKTVLPAQTVGEQHTGVDRHDSFFATCLEIIAKKKAEYGCENDDSEDEA